MKAVKRGKKAVQASKDTRDPSQRFRALAVKRVPRTLHDLQLVKNLASINYQFTDEQATKIVSTLKDEVQSIEEAFMRRLQNKGVPSHKQPFDI